MAIESRRVSVTAVATLLAPLSGDDGLSVAVRNADATNSIDLGPEGVVTAAGYQLGPGASVSIDLAPGERLFAVAPAATTVIVHVLSNRVG